MALDLTALKAAIEKKNEVFYKASVLEQRMFIAMDVLDLIEENKIEPTTGEYFNATDVSSFYREDGRYVEPQLQDAFLKMPSCQVCGIGALFVAGVMRLNNLPTHGVVNVRQGDVSIWDRHMRNFLSPYFDENTLLRIENCFERFLIDGASTKEEQQFNDMIWAMTLVRTTPTQRLTWIMRTIIDQGGEFKPLESKEYKAWLKTGTKKG